MDREDEIIRVGIGLIRRGNAFLIRQRPDVPGSPMPGVWEFPGGKCEPGETPEAAAARECHEETGLPVRILRLRRQIRHRYPHGHVELFYYDAQIEGSEHEPEAGTGFQWVEREMLAGLTFPEANEAVLGEIARNDAD